MNKHSRHWHQGTHTSKTRSWATLSRRPMFLYWMLSPSNNRNLTDK